MKLNSRFFCKKFFRNFRAKVAHFLKHGGAVVKALGLKLIAEASALTTSSAITMFLVKSQ